MLISGAVVIKRVRSSGFIHFREKAEIEPGPRTFRVEIGGEK